MQVDFNRRNVISINQDRLCILCGKPGATQNCFCIPCTGDSTTLKMPRPQEFRDDKNHEIDYLLSPELTRIGSKLIDSYKEDFGKLAESSIEIDYFWRRKGGKSRGHNVLGKCVPVSGALKFYSSKNYLIWLAADHCRHFRYYELTAAVFHQLKHAYFKYAEDKSSIVGPDFMAFTSEIEIFGPWRKNHAAMEKAFQKSARQPNLFERK